MSGTPAGELDLHFGARVHSADGRELGSLVRVVVDRESWDPVALVVDEKARYSGHALGVVLRMFPAEVVVPIRACRSADRERVELSIGVAEFRRLPPYLSVEYHEYDRGQAAAARTALTNIPTAAGIPVGLPPFAELATKAEDEIEIRKDESVMIGHDGHRLGHVEDVVFDSGELAGAVIRLDPAHGGDHALLPVRFLGRSDDGALFVHIDEDQVARLRRTEGAEGR